MKHNSTRIALRWFFRLEILCLCLTFACVGSGIVAERTAYTAQGAPASVQSDRPVRSAAVRLPDKRAVFSLAEYAPLIPGPVGNLFAVFLSFRNIVKNDLPGVFVRLHSFNS